VYEFLGSFIAAAAAALLCNPLGGNPSRRPSSHYPQNMELRSGHISGPPLQLPSQEAKAGFEEGVGLVFSQWTALCLAVEQEWGGHDSEEKANHLIDEVIQWFYKKRGKQRWWLLVLPAAPTCALQQHLRPALAGAAFAACMVSVVTQSLHTAAQATSPSGPMH
jgi:hypothetical protein